MLALLLPEFFGPKSSVGGPMTEMLVLCLVVLAVGMHEAWSMQRGVFGWLVNLTAAIFGGLVAFAVIGMAMNEVLTDSLRRVACVVAASAEVSADGGRRDPDGAGRVVAAEVRQPVPATG